jgi:anti-sigma factor RsiW
MNDELLNILSNSNKDIDNQKLMDYLSGKLSAVEKHDFEKALIDSEMMNDAVEGLEKIKNKNVSALVEQLNTNLHKQLEKKKSKKEKRRIKDLPWLYLSVILILVIILIAFLVIKKHLDSEKQSFNIPADKEAPNTTTK